MTSTRTPKSRQCKDFILNIRQRIPEPVKNLARRARTVFKRQLGGLHEVETLESHIAAVFERYRVEAVLDVGAHRGEYGRFLRHLGYRGPIISFEPVANHFSGLAQNSRTDPQWTAYQIALGERECSLDINVTSIEHFSSFLQPNAYSTDTFGRGPQVVRTERVQVRRLEDVLAEGGQSVLNRRLYLKMDTQGFDMNVLKGVGKCASQIVALQSEVSVKPLYDDAPLYLEAIESMRKMGFELTGLFPVSRDNHMRVIEFDCVMVRPD